MSARLKAYKPNSNWHRLVHLLDINGGTLYKAQLYKPRANYQLEYPEVIRGGMSQQTEYSLIASSAMRYEEQAARMGWVIIQRWNNRAWVTLLPKGRSVLKAFREEKNWDIAEQRAIAPLLKYKKRIVLQDDAR